MTKSELIEQLTDGHDILNKNDAEMVQLTCNKSLSTEKTLGVLLAGRLAHHFFTHRQVSKKRWSRG